jgi:hypothetical protein
MVLPGLQGLTTPVVWPVVLVVCSCLIWLLPRLIVGSITYYGRKLLRRIAKDGQVQMSSTSQGQQLPALFNSLACEQLSRLLHQPRTVHSQLVLKILLSWQ